MTDVASVSHRTMQDRFAEILSKYWGYSGFRGIQREIIESISAGRDTLGLMPTGGGKSLTFQVPALAMEGVCVVITPLVALMKDQVMGLRRRNIRAAAIYAGMSHDEVLATLDNCVFGAVKLLYVSPERLSSDLFITKLRHMKVSFVTVDEAHCISQWGYDFRPSYLKIAVLRQVLPGVPVLALTATATPDVVDDIQEKLGFAVKNVFRMSFERKNIAYVVRHTSDKRSEMLHILSCVGGSSIVYVRSRRRAKDIADFIEASGESVTYFHAGLDNSVKDERQKAWVADKKRVIVATNAFGMGIDKPDVRTVIHFDCPDSIEAYFQEAGRAGRDGKKAYAVLLYNGSDMGKLLKRVDDTFPDREYVRTVYEDLAYFYQLAEGDGNNITFGFDIGRFSAVFRHFPVRVNSALKILDRAGYIEYSEERDFAARVMFVVSRDDLYRLHNNTPLEDKVVEELLRNYTGLFSDFNFIDESYIAMLVGVSEQDVHQALKTLSQKHIVRFIPRTKTPQIRYVQRRVATERVVIPPSVYEERKEPYTRRILAMLDYATAGDVCRSRLLLHYFGEDDVADCGHCDVCLDRRGKLTGEADMDAVRRCIEGMLGDGQKHHITELLRIKMHSEVVDATLEYMMREELVYQEDGYLFLSNKSKD